MDVVEILKKEKLLCKVMILIIFVWLGYFERVMKVGVYGYLLKDSLSEDLVVVICNVMKGKWEVF